MLGPGSIHTPHPCTNKIAIDLGIIHDHILCNRVQEVLLPGGHGLMVRGYRPVINTLAKGLDIRLGHRYAYLYFLSKCYKHGCPHPTYVSESSLLLTEKKNHLHFVSLLSKM